MKKFYSLFIIVLSVFAFSNSVLLAQSKAKDAEPTEEAAIEKEYIGNDIFKSIFFDAGYGARKLSFGLGVRYWNLGLSFGVAGLGGSMPGYYRDKMPTKETAIDIEKHPSINVTTDLYYFHDFSETFTAFVNLGYGAGSDSVLAKHSDNQGTSSSNLLYAYGSESKSGVTFGFGIQYFMEKWLGFGLGYHNFRGVYAQINYFWY